MFVRARWRRRRRRYTARAPRHRRLPHLVDGAVLRDVATAAVSLVFSVFRIIIIIIIIIIVMTNVAENRDDYRYRRRNSYDGNWLLLPAIVVVTVVCIYLRVLFYFRIQPRPT